MLVLRTSNFQGVTIRPIVVTTNAPINVTEPPHTPGRDIAGHLRGILSYLTSEMDAGIEDFDLFCASSKNSGGMDQGIFYRGGLNQESLVRQDGGFWP